MTEWTPGQAKRFAREVKLGKTYYTVRDQSAHAATYGVAQTVNKHVFTSKSGFTAVPMTDGGTSAIGLCRNQGPVYDTEPQIERARGRDLNDLDVHKRARGLFGR